MYYKIKDGKFCGFYDSIDIEDGCDFYDINEEDADELIRMQNEEFSEIFYHSGELISFNRQECKPNYIKPYFDCEKLEWIETATQEEIDDYNRKEEVRFYNQELEFASKAVAELKCDIISPEDFEDVKVYMQSIDPYAQTYKFRDRKTRPDIFNRYQ